MDLIYSAHDKTELGIIRKFALDYEISAEKNNNNFELELSINNYSIQNGCYFYAENTEIGGIVDSTKIDTSKRIIFFGGRTWRGILASKIIQPAVGQDYVIVSGEANEVIEGLLSDNDLSDMFKAETIPSELVLTNYRFDRYTDLHSGLIKMLSQNGYKLKIQHKDDGYVYLSAVPIVDFEQEREITSHLFDFVITKRNPTANHMIGLGKGQLKDRLVVHRYLDAYGHISTHKHFTGINEVTAIYENDNEDDVVELAKSVEEKLLECAVEDGIDINTYDLEADLGDRVVAYDATVQLEVAQLVTDVIINANDTLIIKKEYKIGDGLI